MRQREEAIKEILEWLRAGRASLDLKRLEYDPLAPVRADKLNAIHIHCTRDRTVKSTTKDRYGYPRVQVANVVFECWLKPDTDHVSFYEEFLRIMIAGEFSSNTTSMVLNEKVGPFDGGVPDAKVLQLHTELRYVDMGIE